MNYKQLKQLSILFNRIFDALDGARYFNKEEKRENEKHFIYSVVYKDYKTLLSLIEELQDSNGYNDNIIKDIKNVIYRV